MTKSVGVDIENIYRFKNILSHITFDDYQGVLNSVFTEPEKQYCLKKRFSYKHFAVRYAGKEAFLKALGIGLHGKVLFSDIEYINDKYGKPYPVCTGEVLTQLKNKNINQMDVSFSHTLELAIAVVILGG